jgi:hypothetical protein
VNFRCYKTKNRNFGCYRTNFALFGVPSFKPLLPMYRSKVYGVNSRSSSRPVRVSGPQEAQPRLTGALNSGPQVQNRPGAAHPSPRPHRGSAARRPPLRPHRQRAGHSSPQAASHSLGRESGGKGGGAVHLSFQHLLMAEAPAEGQADTPL